MPPRRTLLLRLLLPLAALFLADQLLQHTALADGRFLGHWVIPYDPPLFTEWHHAAAQEIEKLAAGDEALRAKSIFDPELGWCPRPGQDLGLYVHDWAGCRLQLGALAHEKTPGVRRVVALGCSFTQGAEVAGAETWSALLDARHADLEVANLGVAGYGNDQALLRFRRDGAKLEPDEVWLGFMPGATLRVTTHYPPLLNHWASVLTFKPLFTLRGDELALVPSPATDFAAYHRLLSDQSAFFAALSSSDRWVRRAPAAFAPRGTSWTHWFASSRLFVTWREAGGRDTAPHLGDAEGDVYRLTRALILALARESAAAGARFRLVVLPSRADLREARAQGPCWAGLIADLQRSGVESLDTTPALLAAGADDDERCWMPQEHYSPRAGELVATALERALAAAPR
ncbi:MAG: hypothetical protein EXS08_16915 [Planctomycetes bacterium]|nr:hypothetical protein [Planctomycetota bacterium]